MAASGDDRPFLVLVQELQSTQMARPRLPKETGYVQEEERVSPEVRAVIDAAEDLAWMPTANIGGRTAHVYNERKEAHDRLVTRLQAMQPVTGYTSAELRFLLRAIERVAACSFSNRRGFHYYERREAVYQLRGCLDAWKRAAVA